MKNELTNYGGGFLPDYDFFDEAMRDLFPGFRGHRSSRGYMRTDVKETDDAYVMEVEMPGLEKKDINIDFDGGYITVSASKTDREKDKKENYIRRERSFSCSRSYYVGDVKKEDVKAKYENGILTLSVPKEKKELSSSHRIDIE